MVNYSNGKVYKIVPTVEPKDEGDVYFGSTTKNYLSQRMDEHRSSFKRNSNRCSSKILFEKYGVENCVIVLLEAVDAKTNDELKAVEANYIINNKCVNKHIPLRTDKQYYIDNKDTINEKGKQYRINNKDTIAEKDKQYYIDNKDTINKSHKQYRTENVEKLKEYEKIRSKTPIRKEQQKKYRLKKKAEKEAEAEALTEN